MHHRIHHWSLGAALLAACALAQAQDANHARNLAATCTGCHGTNGLARGEMRSLAGLSAARIVASLSDFKSGAQTGTIMHQIAKGYTDEQIRLVAAYFAAQPGAK